MAKYPQYPLVLLEWEDHYSEDNWEDVKEAGADDCTMLIKSVGWLIGEDKRAYRIIQNLSADGQASMRMTILKGTVHNFKVLRKNG
ncbi:MAG TPA: hypothetical protein VFR24_27730 [Candidatus Angelobacter sp.]|nr:hypothetical protein [Candidatus Angelobacter sp.]